VDAEVSGRWSGEAPVELTLLFTDIEGSTRLLQRLGNAYVDVLQRHHAIVRRHLAFHSGREVDTEGDAFFAVFSDVDAAVNAAAAIQRALRHAAWPNGEQIRVRMGLHTGRPTALGSAFVGLDVHVAARICAAANGGQVLLSSATAAGCDSATSICDLGDHRLKDIELPVRLYQLRGPGLTARFPPVRSLGGRPNNLPAALDALVARDRELADISELLATSRLVTLVGVGGIGKTRLALSVARQQVESFDAGAWLVSLDAVTDERFVPHAIGAALGLRDETLRPVLDVLVGYLSPKTTLLLLDNFEHLLGAANTLADLLARAPRLTVLATSRSPLRLPGEHVYPVAPLSTQSVLDGWSAGAELFRQRATASGAPLEESDRSAVTDICARLDGIPLAIELAANRIRTLGLGELARRLDHRLDLLTGEARGRPARQRTLRSTIAWSYDLLGEAEQRTFRALAVFRGGWSVAAAVAMCGVAETSCLDLLTSLVDNSLVASTIDPFGAPRFQMLETMREFGLDQLRSLGEEAAGRQRHAEYFGETARTCEPLLAGADPVHALDMLEGERDNLRAAVLWSISVDRPDIGAGVVAPLWRFYHLRSHLAEGRRLYEDLMACLPAPTAPWRNRTALALAGVTYWQQDYETSRHWYDTALAGFGLLGDEAGSAEAHDGLAFHLLMAGDREGAQAHLNMARMAYSDLADTAGLARALDRLALVAAVDGQLEKAAESAEQSLSQWRAAGQGFGALNTLSLLGSIRREQGHLADAADLLEQATSGYLKTGNNSGLNWMLWEYAALSETLGDMPTAVLLASAADALAQRIGGGTLVQLLRISPPFERANVVIGASRVVTLREEGGRLYPSAAIRIAKTIAERCAPPDSHGLLK
jgi:predicted ATPase/class 3 adenylate cyclase